MLIQIPDVISPQQIKSIQSVLKQANFVDGKISAGDVAQDVKKNEELIQDNSPQMQSLNNILMGALVNNETYKAAIMMKKIGAPFIARYRKGMGYGGHIDNPIMGQMPNLYRTDVSTTLFLNNPDEYEGGDLVIVTQYGEHRARLKAGSAIVYPSTSWHYVDEVTAGERLVCVTWAQSMIQDSNQREILYELWQAREKLLKENPLSKEAQSVDVSYIKLVQMWADT
ncbi:MAG: Fe2+-dependent dioxygenase [gamma proteobacterium symbiont of Taylorina sp.]|nr:Fe2+-dependent dioxygenase [gamma proteobacterium symbiont of Taylorina sp.]